MAARVTGSADGWTVTAASGRIRGEYLFVVRDGAAYLVVRPAGLMMIVR